MNVMRNLRIGLVTVAFLAALTSAATASAHTWKVGGVEAKSKVKVEWTSTIYFREAAGKIQGQFECEMLHKGTVGPGNLGEITSITNSAGKTPIACQMIETGGGQCTSGVEVEPQDLPWATELGVVGISGVWDGWHSHWKIKCVAGRGKFNEECSGLVVPKAENLSGKGEVQLNLLHQLEGGPEIGCQSNPMYVEGYEDMKTVSGETLSVE